MPAPAANQAAILCRVALSYKIAPGGYCFKPYLELFAEPAISNSTRTTGFTLSNQLLGSFIPHWMYGTVKLAVGPAVGRQLRMNGRNNLVLLSMQQHNATELYVRDAGPRDLAFDLRGTEDGIRVFRRFQNFLVHFFIPRTVAAIPAGGVDHNFSGSLSAVRVEVQGPTFQIKSAVNGVQCGVD